MAWVRRQRRRSLKRFKHLTLEEVQSVVWFYQQLRLTHSKAEIFGVQVRGRELTADVSMPCDLRNMEVHLVV